MFRNDGRRVCESGTDRCFLEGGSYWLVQEALTADVVTTLHDLSSDAGCTPQAGGLAPRSGTLMPGEFTCATLDEAVGAKPLLAYMREGTSGPGTVHVFASGGERQCRLERDIDSCALTGTPPFHAVIGGGGTHTYSFGYLGTDTDGCRPFAGGGYHAGTFTEADLDEARFAQCLRVRAGSADPRELVTFSRAQGTGTVSMQAVDDIGSRTCSEEDRARGYAGCEPAGPAAATRWSRLRSPALAATATVSAGTG